MLSHPTKSNIVSNPASHNKTQINLLKIEFHQFHVLALMNQPEKPKRDENTKCESRKPRKVSVNQKLFVRLAAVLIDGLLLTESEILAVTFCRFPVVIDCLNYSKEKIN